MNRNSSSNSPIYLLFVFRRAQRKGRLLQQPRHSSVVCIYRCEAEEAPETTWLSLDRYVPG
jgi:hypothetical protein